MGRNLIETLMGAVVILVAAGFTVFAYRSADLGAKVGYALSAKFEDVSGLSTGSDVRLGGIKIGSVTGQRLDPQTYSAVITMTIQEDVRIPSDSSAAVVSDGLLGSKFVSLTPGAEEAMLEDGGQISYTQSSVNFETLIGKFMFSDGGVATDESADEDSLLGE